MTSKTSTGETPFSLAYGIEAMIPVEVDIPYLQCETYNSKEYHTLMYNEVDLLEEKCDLAALRTASYKHNLKGTSTPKLRREGSKKATWF